ncbi:hypothetical protein MUB23_04175 [Cuneatibacter sp. NSJ-177]|uniref:hypothetical protein n=1 Tax=Cuneatibacter sp. NSJ-177 TaxID=2931401 RepID=UPI001FD29458|nr:hypothetical protein [Cuneatibacter sp. NSJ-177]MCJ7834591.1 hypothetical protein [Cuneatibacter sp. NSJ-177]
MTLMYGKELEDMTLKEIHELEKRTGIHLIFDGCRPIAIRIPCDLPGMAALLVLK